ncbi:MAG: type II toxin-antitoxin system HicB family antitoxin [Proteobacteria bacterium]|nr:type II toxin-antitoxin system HicB family antitoxin [Pseudomonadota bacterium]MCL2307345.1 type II toxin-antitoxin system HicB family antitoxin [Pseudomonadota bacterium]
MFYPAYVHKDTDSAWSVTLPDFPGCFSAADELEGLPTAIQEAVEVYFDDEDADLPAPSSPEQWMDDERFQGGYWMLVDLDTSKINTRAVRLNISLPERLVKEIDVFAQSQHLSRSAFLARAAEREMRQGK